jgi:DNA (cytosine-5)-methyltransferase 1
VEHYGDITKLSGYELPVVDVITGGSPCQDLSVAGKRAGLAGKRSGLFMEQIRIVKEMRERDRNSGRTGILVRPRYMVWENVPGAFSSGKPKGADFAAVIEEIIKVCEEGASVSVCVPDGGWTKSGCYYAEDGSWSIAWRVHDAQFWGVPQRRKRIALVADFGGLSAPEILFERKGSRWHFAESKQAWEDPSD